MWDVWDVWDVWDDWGATVAGVGVDAAAMEEGVLDARGSATSMGYGAVLAVRAKTSGQA